MRIEWSADAIADLDRFARFLHDRFPTMARIVGRDLVQKTRILADNPSLSHSIAGRDDRQVVLHVLNAAYVVQYRVDIDRLVILRVFHGREARDL